MTQRIKAPRIVGHICEICRQVMVETQQLVGVASPFAHLRCYLEKSKAKETRE